MSIWLILLIAFAVLAFLAHPSLRYGKCRRWRGERFAHRGLHDAERGLVENTLPAFIAAGTRASAWSWTSAFPRTCRWWSFTTTTFCAWRETGAKCAS